jgi:homoserine O-acetyltransferase/O-succinyltransferase
MPLNIWRPGDPPGDRRFVEVLPDGLGLEAGARLPGVVVAYETWGELDRLAGNAVLVLHALSGDSHAAGPTGPGHPTRGWWDGLIGPGLAIDTERFFVVCPNALGGCQGTTGPSSISPDGKPYGGRFPIITIRDQVAVEVALADDLGIARWAAVIGGSMGGMRAIEWCAGQAERVARGIVISTSASASAEEIALCSLQIRAIKADPAFRGGDYYEHPDGPDQGMALARGIGHLSYRSGAELQARFGRDPQGDEDPLKGGRYAVESYLEYQGDRLRRRFDGNSYIVLSEAMNHHDVGRSRGGARSALAAVSAEMTVAGISSDRLYPLGLQHELAEMLPGRPEVQIVESAVGHDGFLVEIEAVGAVVAEALTNR